MAPARMVLAALVCACLPAAALAYEGAVERAQQPEEPKAPVLTRAPELVQFVQAPYPEPAREAGLSGEVGLLVDIGADGRVAGAEVIRPAGHGFDEAAVEAVKRFVFSPAELDGVPSAVRIEYVYRFVLQEKPPEPEPAPAPPPPVTLRGRIIERASRTPIAGANLRCREHAEEALTGADGAFELHPPPGRCTVEVRSGGHQDYVREEAIEAGAQLEVTYHLMPKKFGLFQTVVRGEREKREATRRTLERDEIQKVPGTFGDPVRVIQNMPGVARAPYLGGQLIVRGASPSETGTYLDGVEIPLLFHFLGGPSVVNPELLDRLDFLPGGFGPRYGRAIGGIVDAQTRRGSAEAVHGSFKVDFIDSAAFVEAPVGEKTSVAVGARRSYVDVLLPAVTPIVLPLVVDDPSRVSTINVLPRYWDYQLRADHGARSDAHSFTLMAFGSDDQLKVSATGVQREREIELGFRTNFHRLRGAWVFRSGSVTNVLAPWGGYENSGGEMSSDTGGMLDGDGVTWSAGLRDELTWELPGGHKVRLGADLGAFATRIDVNVPHPPEYRTFPGADDSRETIHISRDYGAYDYGFYNEFELRLGERLLLLPGLRIDQFRLQGQNRSATDPRFNARFKLSEQTALKGSLGHYTTAPDVNQFDREFGNRELDLPKAFQSALGCEHRFTDAVSLDVTGFYNRRYDLVVSSSEVEVSDDGTVEPKWWSNDGLGRAYGIELLLRHDITSDFFGWLAYTLSRSETRRRGQTDYAASSYDQTHILAAVGQYRFGNGWSVGSRFRLVTGRPRTPVIASTFDADRGRYLPIYGEPRSERDPMFHQLDLRVDREWLFETWMLGAYLDVQNVYWADNVEAVQWDYRYRLKAYVPGIPILPTLGVKGSF